MSPVELIHGQGTSEAAVTPAAPLPLVTTPERPPEKPPGQAPEKTVAAAVAPAAEIAPPPRRRVMRQYELVERVKAYDPGADEDLLNRAYVFAMKAHGSQKRISGDPYFHHPVEVAGILAGLKLDAASIATGLLHDTVEDTGVELAEIERQFGPVVARLVDGVTKLAKIKLQSAQHAQAENFRKLLLAMSEDIRVLLVKLADRLHNMRTLHFLPKAEKRRRIATETMEIYAPLAARIGMDDLKAELEDLAFAELHPDAAASITHRLQQLRRDDTGVIQRIVDVLRATLAAEGIEADIAGREKSRLSIWRKMQRKNISFEQLADIMAFRILVDTVGECYAALGTIHAGHAMLPGRFKDFISTPKPNGYKSLHTTIIGPEQRKIEVQIRTRSMHEVAQLGVAAHWAYKQDHAVTDGKRYRWIRGLLDILEQTSGPEDFLEHTKLEMFSDQVFCFTPRGDLHSLPRGATPIDFAYAVHSEVGDHCIGARVDGRMVQLRHELRNGDQVEIITSRNAWPSAAWERFVVTGKARARIRRYLRGRQRQDLVARGRDMLHKSLKGSGIRLSEKVLETAAGELKQRSVEDLLVAVGEGHLAARIVTERLLPRTAVRSGEETGEAAPADKVVPLRRARSPAADAAPSVLDGLPEGVAFQFAGCCHPVPGDPIVGIVRTGRPVSVHRSECWNVRRMAANDVRLIDVAWGERPPESHATARLSVMVQNKPGALGTVTTIIGKEYANISDVRIGRRAGDIYEMLLDVEVAHLDQLLRTQAALRSSSIVVSVERTQS